MNTTESVRLEVMGLGEVPSFKNRKIAIKDSSSGKLRTLTEPSIKERMDRMENAIVFALYSESQIREGETHSECLKRLRTYLCGLYDDSIHQIPQGEWDVVFVPKGEEGFEITIEQIKT